MFIIRNIEEKQPHIILNKLYDQLWNCKSQHLLHTIWYNRLFRCELYICKRAHDTEFIPSIWQHVFLNKINEYKILLKEPELEM